MNRFPLVLIALALATTAVITPAGAQQTEAEKYLKPLQGYLDPRTNRWVYYDNGQAVVSVPASRVERPVVRRNPHVGSGGHGTGRHYTTGGNRTGTTRTQTIHAGEPHTRHPGGSAGRGR
ncbi:MAG: hypothetical protein IPK81_23985 [Rhodospirillales bacterium]|nr:MAG: hypothetical protein IPK81_23985 [Rhodospirillales bacterium]